MRVQSVKGKAKAVHVTKTTYKKKHEGVRMLNMVKTIEAVISGTSVKTIKRKLGKRKYHIYAIKKEACETTHNRKEILNVAEEIYCELIESFSPY